MGDKELNKLPLKDLEKVSGGCSEESGTAQFIKNDNEDSIIAQFLKNDDDFKPAEAPINLDRPNFKPSEPSFWLLETRDQQSSQPLRERPMTGIWQATLRDLIEVRGEADVKAELSDFSCLLNPDVEYFIRQKAIEFAR